jgi:hypothetical protein
MTESESYWLRLVDELAAVTQPLRGSSGDLENEPLWVDKLTCELFNMVTPKMQLRAGMKPTPDKIGVMIGSHFVQMAQAEAFSELPRPTTEPGSSALGIGLKLASLPAGFDVEAARQKIPAARDKICSVVVRILRERPLQEASEFYRGFSRGLNQNPKALVPQVVNGVPQFTGKQLARLRTIMVYILARHNWRDIDQLETSQQAFEWFEKRLPAQILGNDPERIRKMFYRVDKQFKKPGRLRKRDRPPVRVLR